ncbi:hypothetical protein VP1G_02314 [Cytospora mali]|uniref:Protein kinase domain-containing protein n=1 Tax=Cytospora mali TaxID=578113 RepID=A0A194UTG3_CYTMA|nr:hypothetical protein VP1G_02314 [Valsa mali var. pyri (nom. inval.)]
MSANQGDHTTPTTTNTNTNTNTTTTTTTTTSPIPSRNANANASPAAQSGCLPTNPSDPDDPLDYTRPPFPYVPGACFDIKPHNPPPPFDGVITRQIRCGQDFGVQLVECHLGDTKAKLVAKIFDPLYVFDDEWHSPTYFSERYYSSEAAAYMRIKKRGLDGKFTPKSHGCWFFEIPVRINGDREVRREVRLILQEFIPGDTMEALIASVDVRMEVMAQLLEMHSKLAFIGVWQEDRYSRNVMVGKDSQDKWRVTLIDFSHSSVMGLETSKFSWRRPWHEDDELPISPIAICDGHWPVRPVEDIEEHWIDKKYRTRRERHRWMDQRWGKSSGRSNQYQPVGKSQLV